MSWKKWQVSWSPEWRNMSPRELPSTTPWSTITSRIPTYSVSVEKDLRFMRNLFLEFQIWPNTQTSWRQHHRSLNRQDCDSFPAGIYIYSNYTVISDFCEQMWLCHLFLWRQSFTSPVVVQASLQAARNWGRPKQPWGALASGQSVLAPWAHEGRQDFFSQL